MTSIGQVWHVARKDLRESRWPFIVYVALVAVAAARVTGWWSPSRVLEMAMFLVVIAGVVLVATLIQSDSPIRADAFWTTRPLSPIAVLLAKILLVVVIVVGLPVTAQAFAVSSFDIHGIELVRRLSTATSAYARWLLIALALASMTKDLKSLIVMFVCIPVALGITSDLWTSLFSGNAVFEDGGTFDQLVVWVGAVGCLVFPFWLYARRDRGWRSLAAGTVAAACGLMGVLNTPGITSPQSMEDKVVRGDAIAISLSPGQQATNPNEIQLQVRATSVPAGQRLTFRLDRAELDLADGTKIPVHPVISTLELGWTRPPSLASSVWLTPDRDSAFAQSVILRPLLQQESLLAKGIRKITVYGRISAANPRTVGSLRLAPGARLGVPGRRVSIRQWVQSGQTEITINSIELPGSANVSRQLESGSRVVTYALVNDARHEAVPLTLRGTSGGSSSLVLPGDEVLTRELTLDTREAFVGRNTGLDGRWLDGARVWLVDWVPAASYPVRAELTLP